MQTRRAWFRRRGTQKSLDDIAICNRLATFVAGTATFLSLFATSPPPSCTPHNLNLRVLSTDSRAENSLLVPIYHLKTSWLSLDMFHKIFRMNMRLVIDDMNSRLSQENSVVLTGVFELSCLEQPWHKPCSAGATALGGTWHLY